MKKGPLSERTWGRIWARAFTDSAFRATIEVSPRQAVIEFLGDEVVPLFAPMKTTMVVHCSRPVYDELKKQKGLDDASGGARKKVTDLKNGKSLGDADIDNIVNMLHGNEWTLTERKTGTACTIRNAVPAKNTAKVGDKELSVTDWARVYAEAVLDEAYFYPLLKRDAAGAVQELINRNRSASAATFTALPHNADAPILKLPTLNQLFNANLPAALKGDLDLLLQVLADLAADIESDYECILRICLTC